MAAGCCRGGPNGGGAARDYAQAFGTYSRGRSASGSEGNVFPQPPTLLLASSRASKLCVWGRLICVLSFPLQRRSVEIQRVAREVALEAGTPISRNRLVLTQVVGRDDAAGEWLAALLRTADDDGNHDVRRGHQQYASRLPLYESRGSRRGNGNGIPHRLLGATAAAAPILEAVVEGSSQMHVQLVANPSPAMPLC